MSTANPQHEPTMEEILASIRKIISEDQPDGAKAGAARAPSAVREPSAEPADIPDLDADVLELTDEIQEDATGEAAPDVAGPIENDIVFENIEMEAATAEPGTDHDDLISEDARDAMGRAFANLDREGGEDAALAGGTIEAIFVRAVQDAFAPTLNDWVEDHKAEIMEQLKPLIRAWMDEHLPPVIEAAVRKEFSRVASGSSKPHRR